MIMKELGSPVKFLKGVGPQRANILKKISIQTIEDLLYYFPYRYADRKNFVEIAEVKQGLNYSVKGRIASIKMHNAWKRRNFNIISINVADDSGTIKAVWFNQRFLANILKEDEEIMLYGQVVTFKGQLQFNSPEFEIISQSKMSPPDLGADRIIPVYSTSRLLSQRQLRKFVKSALDEFIIYIKDFLPYNLRKSLGLANLAQALINIHFPQNRQLLKQAYKRLCFDDCFLYQVPIILRKLRRKKKKGIALESGGWLFNKVLNSLSFQLTPSQDYVLKEIKNDLAKPVPMQRLLQGDVGSGKTIVAFLAALVAIESGAQVAFMVPTEIIAKQHFRVLSRLSNVIRKDLKMALLTGSVTTGIKRSVYEKARNGKIDLLIGTHALLSGKVKFKKLGLVIIDEQHKFGVEQRARLSKEAFQPNGKFWPHNLIMTATPIPRTLALTVYGDLDISLLKELPPGRKEIITLRFSQSEVDKAYELLKQIVASGKQAYIIYPIIKESLSLDLKAAEVGFRNLKQTYFKDFKLALIHSRIKQAEQERIMQEFCEGKIDILVATSILEVGVDVANASCILIEEADRFGLSSLHQLRGRVGRSSQQAHCFIVSSARSPEANMRIDAITSLLDGFKIAEVDLKIRGPGQFFGRQQHGLSELRLVDPLRQMHILKDARNQALRLLEADPELNKREHACLQEALKRRYPNFESLMMTG